MSTERELALAELTRACEPESFPQLLTEELDAILDATLRAVTWAPSTYLKAGTSVYPVPANGRRYLVTISGTTAADPPTWTTVFEGMVVSGGVTLVEDGLEYSSTYDVNSAIKSAWRAKAAKASRLMSTGGMNMHVVFENCLKMVEVYDIPLVG